MKKIYTIIGCASGEDYSTDDPFCYGSFLTLKEARAAFKDIVNDWKDGFSEDCDYGYYNDRKVFEFTDFDHDEHGIFRIVESSLKEKGE